MKHQILAPNHWAAKQLVALLKGAGHIARHAQYNGHNVVLAIAPLSLVNEACRRAQFRPGLETGYNAH